MHTAISISDVISSSHPSHTIGSNHEETFATGISAEQITEAIDRDLLPLAPSDRNHSPYTISADGHYVGEDGFIVPADYAEFQERFPRHVGSFVRRRMPKATKADQEDRESDLQLYLMTLAETSKFRNPGANNRPNGCTDKIQTFHPDRAYGVSKGRFLNFVNYMLIRSFITLAKKACVDSLGKPNNLSYFQGESEDTQVVDDEYIHTMVFDCTLRSRQAHSKVESKVVIRELNEFIELHNPELISFLAVVIDSTTFLEAQQTLGLSDQLFTRSRNRLEALIEHFNNGTVPPRQRKVYRARDKRSK